MINLQQDIQDLIDIKSPKEAAIFQIQMQPYFRTLGETVIALSECCVDLKKLLP